MQYITFNNKQYPHWQSIGNAAQWIMPLANHVIGDRTKGLDIGCNRPEWAYPGATLVDPEINEYSADSLPDGKYEYLFSSHMLEHYKGNWMTLLDYWMGVLEDSGVLFLYLPHVSQEYWHPRNNRKHVHSFNGDEIKAYLQSLGYDPYVTPVDYNNSFAVVCYKVKAIPHVKGVIGECDLVKETPSLKKIELVRNLLLENWVTTPFSIKNFEQTNYSRQSEGLKELSIKEYNEFYFLLTPLEWDKYHNQ